MNVKINNDRIVPIPNAEVKKIMTELEVDEITACRAYLEDNAFILPENHDRLEVTEEKAKRQYTKGKTTTEPKKRTKKENLDKQKIIKIIENALKDNEIDEVIVTNNEKYIDIVYKNENYTINLVNHRKK